MKQAKGAFDKLGNLDLLFEIPEAKIHNSKHTF